MNMIFWKISLFKTLKFNLIYFKFRVAIHIPVFVSRHTKLNKLKGKITITSEIKPGMIQIGFGNVPIFDRTKSRTVWNFGAGEMIFKGKCIFGHGSRIGCGGTLVFGNNFQITAESIILCNKRIEFGENVLISWQCQITDCDFHKIIHMDNQINPNQQVIIGSHVWIASHAIINKGVILPNDTVVASGSVVTSQFLEQNTIIGGVPARVIKNNIDWAN